MSDRFEQIRLLEALFFASREPLGLSALARHFPEGLDLGPLIEELQGHYANRGVNLATLGNAWAFRTAPDLGASMVLERTATRKLSRVALEALAIIAYHQPVTRTEVEEIRGVALSRGTLDLLLEIGWVKPKGRRRTPGKPVTWGTTGAFLDHFGLASLDVLPGMEELQAAGLVDTRPAISALSARGQLFSIEDAVDQDADDEEEDGSEADFEEIEDDLLAATFAETEEKTPEEQEDDALSDIQK